VKVSGTDVPTARIILHDGVGNVLARANNQNGGALLLGLAFSALRRPNRKGTIA
jgi:hypothetical protein